MIVEHTFATGLTKLFSAMPRPSPNAATHATAIRPGFPASSPRSPHRSQLIDAWRAFACLAIVVHHGSLNYLAADLNHFVAACAAVGRYGNIGVAVFFVISGYCLAEALAHRAAAQVGPIAFWRDRLLRIFPVYWCALALAIILSAAATPLNHLDLASAFPASLLGWLGDITLTSAWLGSTPRLNVSWSLNYEIGFYLLVGTALFRPLRAPGSRLAFFAALTLLSHLPSVAAHFPLLALWPQFACGVAVHSALHSPLTRSFRTLCALYPAVLLICAPPGLLALIAPASALLLLATLALESRLPAMPRALVTVGAASYSIYLVHVAFMSPAINFARRFVPAVEPAYAVVWIAHLGLGVAAGLVFHRLIELPCEQLRRRLSA